MSALTGFIIKFKSTSKNQSNTNLPTDRGIPNKFPQFISIGLLGNSNQNLETIKSRIKSKERICCRSVEEFSGSELVRTGRKIGQLEMQSDANLWAKWKPHLAQGHTPFPRTSAAGQINKYRSNGWKLGAY